MSEHEIGQFITIGLITAAIAIFIGTRLFILFRKWNSVEGNDSIAFYDCSYNSNKILLIISVIVVTIPRSRNLMLDEYKKKLRNMQDKIFEQSLDLVYFSKIETKMNKNYLQSLLKIEALIQKSITNFYMTI